MKENSGNWVRAYLKTKNYTFPLFLFIVFFDVASLNVCELPLP